MKRLIVTVAALLAGLGGGVAPAHAHDSLAPVWASHPWLPREAWVMNHWVPFDEERLYKRLRVDNRALERWLRNDHHTIAQLARRRSGDSVAELTRYLVRPWRPVARPAALRRLRERTTRMLTQGHLAQHVLFHYFHGTMSRHQRHAIFGVGRDEYVRLRALGQTPMQIGLDHGRTAAEVTEGMAERLRYSGWLGEREGEHSPAQGDYMLRRRLALLPCLLERPSPKFDPGNPYGDPNNSHGPHRRGDRNGLMPGSKQRVARRHPSSCWHEPDLSQTVQPAARQLAPRPATGTHARESMLCDARSSASGEWW